jgi:hypothetical protein
MAWTGATNISAYTEHLCGKKLRFPLFSPYIDMAEQNVWQLHKKQGSWIILNIVREL